jgi:hypothetical protein
MVILIGIFVLAFIFAWYVLRDLNKPLNETLAEQPVTLKTVNESNVTPRSVDISEPSEVVTTVHPKITAKTKTTKTKSDTAAKKKAGRKKKPQ